MTLHEKIIELSRIQFDVKFEPFIGFHPTTNIRVSLRYHGPGAVKVENSTSITPDQFIIEAFLVSEIDRLYKEMKSHAIGHQTLEHNSND